MHPLTAQQIKDIIKLKYRRLLALASLSILFVTGSLAQPVWVAGPTATPGRFNS